MDHFLKALIEFVIILFFPVLCFGFFGLGACEILAHSQGLNSYTLHFGRQILTTGLQEVPRSFLRRGKGKGFSLLNNFPVWKSSLNCLGVDEDEINTGL